ncbi:hypothetical protein C5167_011431 [Papaver somniferum]|uniref:Uncharacterized protein n=1 Tax=Papaver somniferum TaxID=3469 RepID=A0A4Y7K4J0_PAPSO|nr:hypothetical protein C5167_011431 [Papaver somniferum]
MTARRKLRPHVLPIAAPVQNFYKFQKGFGSNEFKNISIGKKIKFDHQRGVEKIYIVQVQH